MDALIGFLFRINREGIKWTIRLLDIRSTDHVLEVGFGTGYGIQQAAVQAAQGRVAGVDCSEVMVQQARRWNAEVLAAGAASCDRARPLRFLPGQFV